MIYCRLFIVLCLPVLAACALLPLSDAQAYTLQEGVTYAEPEGYKLDADIYLPSKEGSLPAVVLIHGGGWIRGERADMNRYAKTLAKQGFVVMNISYRLAPEFEHPAQLRDCQAAVAWLRQHADRYRVNPARIAAFGYSAGGHLAMMLGTHPSRTDKNTVQAVVSGGGPADLRVYPDSPYVKALLGGGPKGREDSYADASPLVHVDGSDVPTYLYHGKMDRLVEVEQARNMAVALEKAEVPVVLDLRPFGHMLSFFIGSGPMERIRDFLLEHLTD